MYGLQTSVTIGEKTYAIRTEGDYRMVLDCFDVLNDASLSETERIIILLIIFYADFNDIEDVLDLSSEEIEELINAAYTFFDCGRENSPSAPVQFKAIDWTGDAQLICSAVNKIAGEEVRAVSYMHWWTFLGYFNAVGESALSTVVEIRSKIAKGKTLEKWESDFRRENPQYFVWDSRTLEQKEEDDFILDLWNKDG